MYPYIVKNEVTPHELTKLPPRAIDQLVKTLVPDMRNPLPSCWSGEYKILPYRL